MDAGSDLPPAVDEHDHRQRTNVGVLSSNDDGVRYRPPTHLVGM
jgi:hypothetical protein